jgi:hypothetical protein
MLALARGGGRLFWERSPSHPHGSTHPFGWRRSLSVALLVSPALLLALFARPVADYAARAAAQLHTPQGYVAGILGGRAIARETRP